MNVLIACEESQRVCSAFRARGHNAFSCDLLPCSGGHPEWHIQGDVLKILNPELHSTGMCEDPLEWYGITFNTVDGTTHFIDDCWDLIIAHPPCTRLCNSRQRWLYYGDNTYREKKLLERALAIEFFLAFTKAKCSKIAIENPMGIMSTLYRKPDFTYNPYDFEGETDCKKTAIWLIGNLQPLRPTRTTPLPKEQRTQSVLKGTYGGAVKSWNDPECARLRSQTPLGVAKAMSEQWG